MSNLFEQTYKKYGPGITRLDNHDTVEVWPYMIRFIRTDKCIVHRLDGPAMIWEDGDFDWWINGFCITYQIRPWANEIGIDLDNLTDDDKVLIKLAWGNFSI